ncbi:MAG: hypothetical protein RR620_14505 [Clostridium sp.]
MESLKGKTKKERKELSIEEIINLLLISVVTIMPFIVTSAMKPMYVMGKVYYLYIISIILAILLIKKRKVTIGREGKLAIVFIITIIMTILVSEFKYIAIFGNSTRKEGLLTFLVYILMFITAMNYIDINNKVKKVVFNKLNYTIYSINMYINKKYMGSIWSNCINWSSIYL